MGGEIGGVKGTPAVSLLRSVLDTAGGTGLEDAAASCLLFRLCISPLQSAGAPLGPSCTLHSHIDLFFIFGWGREVVREMEGWKDGEEEKGELFTWLTSP